MSKFTQCIILFGGSSEERMVSVASAQNLSRIIPEAALWFWDKEGKIFLVKQDELAAHENPFMNNFIPTSVPKYSSIEESLRGMEEKTIIIGLHGTEGEDGTLQALLEEHRIRFTGSDSKSSRIAFDKRRTKSLAASHGIETVADLAVNDFDEPNIIVLNEFFKEQHKIVLKPLSNGSSYGLFIISSEDELNQAIKEIKSRQSMPYMAEAFIEGREITVGVWQKNPSSIVALPCSEIRLVPGGQFDYQGKYLGKGVEEITPALLEAEQTKACQELAERLHRLLGCTGYSRTDMILTQNGPVLLEINTLPGLTKASFIPQQLAAINTDLRSFFDTQIAY